MNKELAEKILSFVINRGACSFCLCPGGRSAPFVEVLSSLEEKKELEILYFFEERSAGFFALGRVRRDLCPAVLITTSGTAVAELLPSVIESHYSGLPLILLTADRPSAQRAAGAPQTLEDPLSIFKGYTSCSLNLSVKNLPLFKTPFKKPLRQHEIPSWNCIVKNSETTKEIKKTQKTLYLLNQWSPEQGNLHINVSFDEPLVDEKPKAFISPKKNLQFLSNLKIPKKTSIYPLSKMRSSFQKDVENFLHTSKKPLILIGELKTQEKSFTENLLKDWDGLLYTEPLSSLGFLKNRLSSGEKILQAAFKKQAIDGILRVGGIPRVRFWRDLEKIRLPVFHLTSPPYYTGLSYHSLSHPLNPESLKTFLSLASYKGDSLKAFDKKQSKKWSALLKQFPGSEPHWIWLLRESLKENESVFLGNSLPLRLWDMTDFSSNKNLYISGQAGVNGIDGLISRFFGECCSKRTSIAIVGDLSALYDLAGFWNAKKRGNHQVFVINNFGGRIFSRLYSNPRFLNEHHLSFKPQAKMWGLDYELYDNPSHFVKKSSKNPQLIEIRPEIKKTEKCFKAYDSLWDIDKK